MKPNTLIYIEHNCLGNPIDRDKKIVCALIDDIKPILEKHDAKIYRIVRKHKTFYTDLKP